ncbi:kinase-like domain-containing protein [Rhizophagus irregularis DAOM 181602=DAOM 197198]|nr:kinase-like domain-containing protein [Rhizophagus irregularis DAOM 181602=DAOM 197198]
MVYAKNVSILILVLIGNAKHFQQNFKNWTSGNHEVDKLIQKTQLKAKIETHMILSEHIIFTIAWCYGITIDPESKNFMIVMGYANDGLDNIHQKGLIHLIHRDFHCGNILRSSGFILITDLGLCRPVNVKSSQNECKELYGVLPYVAPEVLRGKGYTQESDIYGFGIIAYEVCTGLPPYHDITHDKFLAISISDKINEKLTSSSSLYTGPTLSYTTNPQAVFTSRLLDFKNLPEPKNAIDNKDDDNSFGEYSESIEAIDFTKLDLDKSN